MRYNHETRTLEQSYRLFIVNRRGDWLATLVGRDEEELDARAQRFAGAILGSRVVAQEEFDPIGRRAA